MRVKLADVRKIEEISGIIYVSGLKFVLNDCDKNGKARYTRDDPNRGYYYGWKTTPRFLSTGSKNDTIEYAYRGTISNEKFLELRDKLHGEDLWVEAMFQSVLPPTTDLYDIIHPTSVHIRIHLKVELSEQQQDAVKRCDKEAKAKAKKARLAQAEQAKRTEKYEAHRKTLMTTKIGTTTAFELEAAFATLRAAGIKIPVEQLEQLESIQNNKEKKQ